MQNFAFRLDRILRWRQEQFEAEEARLGTILAERERMETARNKLRKARDGAVDDLLTAGPMDGLELAALGGFRARLEKELETSSRQLQEVGRRLAAQKTRVVDAQRRVRLLEKLRRRKLDEWQTTLDREQQNFAGEAFLARWNPGSRSAKTH